MSSAANTPNNAGNADPTADYRKYPKGPNFLLIVILACISFLIILAVAVFVIGIDGRKMIPHKPTPTPNSLVEPLRLTPEVSPTAC